MSGFYTKGKEGLADSSIKWTTDNIKVCLLDTASYTVDLATHDNLDDIPAGAQVATSAVLSGRTATDGICDASDITISSVVSSGTVDAFVLFKDTGNPATSRLLAYIDGATSGLPFTGDGGDVTIQWPNGTNKIFRL